MYVQRLQGANRELETEISNLNIFQNDATDFKLESKNIELLLYVQYLVGAKIEMVDQVFSP
jgi:hypothetical protein